MKRQRRDRRVREPVQVYLDETDRSLLEELAARTGLARAELLRRGLRRMADQVLTERAPGWSFDRLVGALGDDPSLPPDLAARHDEYLYGGEGIPDDPGPD
ncbi:MAG TPA: hypothetical protein VEK78_11740 [Gemmatimonadales bacterium]|nr:hypothetical protein [Gemmatimonadales bacterium]